MARISTAASLKLGDLGARIPSNRDPEDARRFLHDDFEELELPRSWTTPRVAHTGRAPAGDHFDDMEFPVAELGCMNAAGRSGPLQRAMSRESSRGDASHDGFMR